MLKHFFVFLMTCTCSILTHGYYLNGFIYDKKCSSNSVSISCKQLHNREIDQVSIDLKRQTVTDVYHGRLNLIDSAAPPDSTYRLLSLPLDTNTQHGFDERISLKVGTDGREFQYERVKGDTWGRYIDRISLQKNGEKKWILNKIFINESRQIEMHEEYFFAEDLNYDKN